MIFFYYLCKLKNSHLTNMFKRYLLIAAAVALLAMPACQNAEKKETQTAAQQTGFPSGDMDKDAQAIADMIIQSSQRMLEGQVNPEEDQARADQMIKSANEFYQKQGRGEEFQQALHDATEQQIDSLGVIMGKGPRPEARQDTAAAPSN